jgi:hypothetical protein
MTTSPTAAELCEMTVFNYTVNGECRGWRHDGNPGSKGLKSRKRGTGPIASP